MASGRMRGGEGVQGPFGVCWASQGEKITDAQIESALWLCGFLMGLHRIPVNGVVAHREVSPGRKTDPPPSAIDMDEWRALLANYLVLA